MYNNCVLTQKENKLKLMGRDRTRVHGDPGFTYYKNISICVFNTRIFITRVLKKPM